MAEIIANGTEIINCGNEICRLVGMYKTEINRMFDILSRINTVAWSGPSAYDYVFRLYADKIKFMSFADSLEIYGKIIKNTGDNVNKIIDKWEAK